MSIYSEKSEITLKERNKGEGNMYVDNVRNTISRLEQGEYEEYLKGCDQF